MKAGAILAFMLAIQVSDAVARIDAAIMDRLKSCDPVVSLAAAREMVKDPKALEDPTWMLSPAYYLYMHGKKDEAVFWLYAGQLRFRYVAAIENGDYEQVLSIVLMTTGPVINNYAFQDVAKLERIIDDVLAWDKATPNPYRAKVTSPEAEAKVRKVYAGLDELKAKLRKEKVELEKTAKLAAPDVQGMFERIRTPPCPKPGTRPFEGAWGIRMCAPNQKMEECGGFYLYLVQRNDRVCGDHYTATPGLGRLNEGGPRSVVGPVLGDVATLQVTSGRDGTRVRASARSVNDSIEWKVVEVLKEGGGDSPLIVHGGFLTRQKNDDAIKRVTEECKAYLDAGAR